MHGLVSKLLEIVPEYKPSEEILSKCLVDCHDIALQYRRARPSLVVLAESAA
jgi:hypothetical protein